MTRAVFAFRSELEHNAAVFAVTAVAGFPSVVSMCVVVTYMALPQSYFEATVPNRALERYVLPVRDAPTPLHGGVRRETSRRS